LNQRVEANRRRWNLAWLLGGAFGGLLAVALAAVLSIQFFAMREATLALFRDKADLLIELVSSRIRAQMDPASAQLAFMAEVLSRPGAEYGPERLVDLLTGALAAAPNIHGVVFAGADGRATVVTRMEEGVEILVFPVAEDPHLARAVADGRARTTGLWSELVFTARIDGPAINRRHPVHRRGEYLGMLGAAVTLRQLPNIVEQSGADLHGGRAFVLRGREHVLAHARLLRPFPGLDPGRPLPRLDEINDPILAAIWTAPPAAPLLGRSTNAHAIRTAAGGHLFLHVDVPEFGEPAWIVGAYFPLADIASPVRTMFFAAAAAAGLLIVALVLALVMARLLARPVRDLADAAATLADLEFSKAKPIPRSRVAELDDQAQAFNRLLGALRWFEVYVPRNLVRRLAREAPPESAERILTVMFTDLAGFTTLSQAMAPAQVAELLNAHFAKVIEAVEASGGTVDKFMGDGTMAF
jgi:HAMP domain-containing protein